MDRRSPATRRLAKYIPLLTASPALEWPSHTILVTPAAKGPFASVAIRRPAKSKIPSCATARSGISNRNSTERTADGAIPNAKGRHRTMLLKQIRATRITHRDVADADRLIVVCREECNIAPGADVEELRAFPVRVSIGRQSRVLINDESIDAARYRPMDLCCIGRTARAQAVHFRVGRAGPSIKH